MPASKARVIPKALRLQTSIGSTPAIPAQIMVAPAIGDIVRPKVPPKAAMEPISIACNPNCAACGVTASLKATVAASPEPEIIAMGVEIMRVIVVVVLLQIAQVIYMGCLRGAGDVIYTTIASTISVTIVRPIASYLLCYTAGLGIIGIWFGVCADQLVRFILTSLRFRSGKWTKIKI